MNEQPAYPQPTPPAQGQPMAPQLAPEQEAERKRTNKRKLTWGLVLLIGPSLLIPVAIFAYAIVNFLIGSAGSDSIQDSPSIFSTISNVFLFLVGAVAILAWLPGIIVGIILLASRK